MSMIYCPACEGYKDKTEFDECESCKEYVCIGCQGQCEHCEKIYCEECLSTHEDGCNHKEADEKQAVDIDIIRKEELE